jgi:hypothetical protein
MSPAAAEKLKVAWRTINQDLGCPTCRHQNGQAITRGLCCRINGPWPDRAGHCTGYQERRAAGAVIIKRKRRMEHHETLTDCAFA